MIIYLSGPIKDTVDFEQKFLEAEANVRAKWRLDEIVNPVKLGQALEDRMGRTPTYEEYMQEDLFHLMGADAIYMLPGHERSSGARCELLIAVMTGKAVYYL